MKRETIPEQCDIETVFCRLASVLNILTRYFGRNMSIRLLQEEIKHHGPSFHKVIVIVVHVYICMS